MSAVPEGGAVTSSQQDRLLADAVYDAFTTDRTLAPEIARAAELVEFADEAALAMVLDVPSEPPTLPRLGDYGDRGRRS